MILSCQQIQSNQNSRLMIDPFDERHLKPNGYTLHLADELLVYEEIVLDCKRPNRVRRIDLPEEGLELRPFHLVLGRTKEKIFTDCFVPRLQTSPAVGRLGLAVHALPEPDGSGYCTLQLFALQAIRIYPGIPIVDVAFHTVSDDYDPKQVTESLHRSVEAQPSLLFTELCHHAFLEQSRPPMDETSLEDSKV